MKLLYVNDALAIYGGLERILIDKLNMFADEGYEVYLITVNQGTHPFPYPLRPKVVHNDLNIRFHQEYQFHGIKRLYKHFQLKYLFRQRLYKSVRFFNPDVIICTRIEMVKTVARVKGHIPLVYESHTSFISRHIQSVKKWKFLNDNYRNRQAKKAQMIVALTECDAKEWRTINPSVSVIPNLVQLNKTEIYSDGLSKSIVFVGRFSKQKDIGSLLRIWQIVIRCHPDWYLHIYGGYGEQQELLLPQIKEMKSNIVIHAPTPNILYEYAHYSILLLTSLYEPFGLVLPEAMSCGLPVIAFDCPYGPAEIVTDGVDGFLVKDRNVNEFANRVCQLIEDEELRVKMGKAGIISSQRYKAEFIMPKWKKLFEQIVNESN